MRLEDSVVKGVTSIPQSFGADAIRLAKNLAIDEVEALSNGELPVTVLHRKEVYGYEVSCAVESGKVIKCRFQVFKRE